MISLCAGRKRQMKSNKAKPTAKGRFDDMTGACAAMITPFTKNNKVNEEVVGQLTEYGLAGGFTGFYLTASPQVHLATGECRVSCFQCGRVAFVCDLEITANHLS